MFYVLRFMSPPRCACGQPEGIIAHACFRCQSERARVVTLRMANNTADKHPSGCRGEPCVRPGRGRANKGRTQEPALSEAKGSPLPKLILFSALCFCVLALAPR